MAAVRLCLHRQENIIDASSLYASSNAIGGSGYGLDFGIGLYIRHAVFQQYTRHSSGGELVTNFHAFKIDRKNLIAPPENMTTAALVFFLAAN